MKDYTSEALELLIEKYQDEREEELTRKLIEKIDCRVNELARFNGNGSNNHSIDELNNLIKYLKNQI